MKIKKRDTGWCYSIKQRSVGGIKNQNKSTCVTPKKTEKVLGRSLIIQAFATVGPPTKVSNNLSSRLAETRPLIEYIHAISPLISASSLISLTVIGKDQPKSPQ